MPARWLGTPVSRGTSEWVLSTETSSCTLAIRPGLAGTSVGLVLVPCLTKPAEVPANPGVIRHRVVEELNLRST